MTAPWVVLKFGGTSVATAERWQAIAQQVRDAAQTHRVWIVASALSQVSNHLELALEQALGDAPATALDWIRQTHEALADSLGLDDDERAGMRAYVDELATLLDGVRMLQEASPRVRARVLSFGELASTSLGLAALRRAGLDVVRLDARDLLVAEPDDVPEATRFLEARIRISEDPGPAEALAAGHRIVLTQGFIARTRPGGPTCLLGRGGSDTSAALFAAMLGAERLDIWTDVHGLFTTDPRKLPSARLITRVRYREAEELAATGAKVLHPRCLGPARHAGVPVRIRHTGAPNAPGTTIGPDGDDEPTLLAVVLRAGVPLVSVRTPRMWGTPGFLGKVFGAFATHGLSVDLVATSQTAVTVTLDQVPDGLDGGPFQRCMADLEALGEVSVLGDASVVSMVGRHIRTVLHELGGAFEAFEDRSVHLVSASSEDLALSFVVDAEDAPRLVRDLHARLIGGHRRAPWLGPTWSALTREDREPAASRPSWWRAKAPELLATVADGAARYVYDLATVRAHATDLIEQLPHVGRRYYAVKANPHPAILRLLVDLGFGLECVSLAEVQHARDIGGDAVPILFTPNFCPVQEYADALALGAEVTIDGPDLLTRHPDVFRGQAIALRIDPGGGLGHDDKVRTAGSRSKFGHPAAHVDEVVEAARAIGVRLTGLHAHVGSGILAPEPWARTAEVLAALRPKIPELAWVDLGGGLGVVERPGQAALDLGAMDAALAAVTGLEGLEIRIEPGRYLVSEAGVLVAPVTQVRTKGAVTFVGLATGMNSLIRPALYGAWHGIHNLSRLDDPAGVPVHVVGPICETGDVLGRDRALPPTEPGDVLLIENAGAYGAVMGSSYNLRPPADEVVLEG